MHGARKSAWTELWTGMLCTFRTIRNFTHFTQGNYTLRNQTLACVQLQTFTQICAAICTLRSYTHFYAAVCTLRNYIHFT
jgi:hypothetical protein